MHYAVGLLPWHAGIISFAIQAKPRIQSGGSICSNVMTVIKEQNHFFLTFPFFHTNYEVYFLDYLSNS